MQLIGFSCLYLIGVLFCVQLLQVQNTYYRFFFPSFGLSGTEMQEIPNPTKPLTELQVTKEMITTQDAQSQLPSIRKSQKKITISLQNPSHPYLGGPETRLQSVIFIWLVSLN